MEEVLDMFLKPLIATIIAAILGGKGIKFVQEGELGIKLRFGKATKSKGKPKIRKPGFIFLIPFLETLKRRHVRQQTLSFDEQEIFIQDDLVFIVSAIVRFRVTDIYKALFEVDDLDQCINDLCMGLLRDVLQVKKHDEMRNTEKISAELLEHMKKVENEWGIKFLDARLTSCAPSDNSAQILSSKASAEIKALAALQAAKTLGAKPKELQGLLAGIVGTPVMTSASLQTKE